jgi:hypothetical protein
MLGFMLLDELQSSVEQQLKRDSFKNLYLID